MTIQESQDGDFVWVICDTCGRSIVARWLPSRQVLEEDASRFAHVDGKRHYHRECFGISIAPGPDAPVEPECNWADPNVCLCCRTRLKAGTVHVWQAGTCRVEPDKPTRGLVAQRTVRLRFGPNEAKPDESKSAP